MRHRHDHTPSPRAGATRRALLALVLLPAALFAQQQQGRHDPKQPAAKLLNGLGSYHQAITTRVPLAQRFFDQGLSLAYAFNHAEAERSFREAARLDTTCAMCWWGVAFVLGPNINAPMDAAAAAPAHAALQAARARVGRASEREKAYVAALGTRYAAKAPADRASLDSAFAKAMWGVARRFPDDPDAATIAAEATMNLSPWNYWTADAKPRPGTTEAVSAFERVLRRTPDHPGACHLYIHAVEAHHPQKAVACADRLAKLMPGAGHIVHMPAHIYIRVGRWNDAIEANVHAAHADESYVSDQRPQTLYTAAYYPHNYHFLALAATMAGRGVQAVQAARDASRRIPLDISREALDLQLQVPFPALTLVSFGRWSEVLAEPLPRADLRLARGLAFYARGVAFAATGRAADARGALDSLRAITPTVAGHHGTILQVATHALLGETALRQKKPADAVQHFQAAAKLEDGLGYMEPPYWFYPVRQSLGVALLEAGRAAEAERAYREDLVRFPENGWSLLGLQQSLARQGKAAEARAVAARFDAAWRKADVKLARSRF